MKYIRLKKAGLGLIMFPDSMTHLEVAGKREVASAGFIDTQNWMCFGESMSLGIGSTPKDTPILKLMVGQSQTLEVA